MKKITIHIFLLLLAFSACTSEESADLSEDLTEVSANEIILSKEQLSSLDLKIGDPISRNMSGEILATGMVDVPPENIAQVSAVINGRISKITHNVLPGKYVKRGGILATAQSMELVQMQQDYLETYLKNDLLSQELERQKILVSQEAGVQKKLQEAENAWKLNRAVLKGLEAKLKIANVNLNTLRSGEITEYFNIYAPFSGFVKDVMVHTGTNFAPNDVLFELINKDHLHVELKVFEKDAKYLQEGQKVLFSGEPFDQEVTASIFLVAKSFDQTNKAVNVHVHFVREQDEVHLIPGQYLSGRIQTAEKQVLVLPESAILREADGNYILVQKEKEENAAVFQKVKIETGLTKDAFVEIISPQNANNVVIEGAQLIAGGTSEE
ncbi:MAG: efflux RND transporter periplasmic adaptor subunit [Cytophagales bacterium]|nr:efflux RND transporter periplasmic adaptor subunit [Cytophagales bacterium]